MIQAEFQDIKLLGVINITPNSFSDPKKHLDQATLIETLSKFKKRSDLVFDFGFESTAPMNQSISLEEERFRFGQFFENIKDFDFNNCWISFDTYRPSNYLYFERIWNERFVGCQFIFNDVSGVIDNELIDLLRLKLNQSNFHYVYCTSNIPTRDLVLKHMSFAQDGDIINSVYKNITNAFLKFKELGIENKIILDPSFGFSKSFEQNWDLINGLPDLIRRIRNEGIGNTWMIGVSKKSFLRAKLENSKKPYEDSEVLHSKIIKDIINEKLGHVMFRVHDPGIFS